MDHANHNVLKEHHFEAGRRSAVVTRGTSRYDCEHAITIHPNSKRCICLTLRNVLTSAEPKQTLPLHCTEAVSDSESQSNCDPSTSSAASLESVALEELYDAAEEDGWHIGICVEWKDGKGWLRELKDENRVFVHYSQVEEGSTNNFKCCYVRRWYKFKIAENPERTGKLWAAEVVEVDNMLHQPKPTWPCWLTRWCALKRKAVGRS
eukprot:TRINITY_DN39022_c0_g1_i2.p1 TRINITY_DN39022_c0_g1~~TRINITY_DN39022_c0_g1_i2.p1  ORF type:complete len:207 (-),score=23.15 TRINITY_DN39022_c0_g1_i2:104-724(-)